MVGHGPGSCQTKRAYLVPQSRGPIAHPDPLATPPAACLATETSLYRAAPGHPEAGPARSLRLSVRTSDFQSEKTGSTPVGSANKITLFCLLCSEFPKSVSRSCPDTTPQLLCRIRHTCSADHS